MKALATLAQRRSPSVAFCAFCLISSTAMVSRAEAGRIDSQTRTIRCTGRAAPSPSAVNVAMARIGAEKAALLDAQRNLLETLKSSKIDGFGDALKDPGLTARVLGVMKGCKVVDKHYYSDGGVDVDVELPLDVVIASLTPAPQPGNKIDGSSSKDDVKQPPAPNAAGGDAANVVH